MDQASPDPEAGKARAIRDGTARSALRWEAAPWRPCHRALQLGDESQHAAPLQISPEESHGLNHFGRSSRDPVTRTG